MPVKIFTQTEKRADKQIHGIQLHDDVGPKLKANYADNRLMQKNINDWYFLVRLGSQGNIDRESSEARHSRQPLRYI